MLIVNLKQLNYQLHYNDALSGVRTALMLNQKAKAVALRDELEWVERKARNAGIILKTEPVLKNVFG